MRIFITGASGFIGSQLARLLVKEKAEVYALLRPESDSWRLGDILGVLKIVKGDLLHPEQGWLDELEAMQP
jgi:nucleoside-diphosphate-sugar epimerase